MKWYNLVSLMLFCSLLMVGCTTLQNFFEEDVQPTASEKLPSQRVPLSPKSINADRDLSKEEEPVSENTLSSYRLGPGDRVSIKVFGEEDLSLEARLSDGGTIPYPLIGELQVSGLTIGELEKKIITKLDGEYLINPKVTVTILEYRQFFINGEVQKPGGYAFIPGLTINKAISLAGGFTELASHNSIFILREGRQQAIKADLNTFVLPGDIITVKESFF